MFQITWLGLSHTERETNIPEREALNVLVLESYDSSTFTQLHSWAMASPHKEVGDMEHDLKPTENHRSDHLSHGRETLCRAYSFM